MSKIQDIKTHIRKHKTSYIAGSVCALFGAGITCLLMRDASSQLIGPGSTVTAQDGFTVLGKRVVMNNVSYISSNRQGPPSWVVRCIETNAIFTSQAQAAAEMNLDASSLSKHLNGVFEHVGDYHFERVCLAA